MYISLPQRGGGAAGGGAPRSAHRRRGEDSAGHRGAGD